MIFRNWLAFSARMATTLLLAAATTMANAAVGDFEWVVGIGGTGDDVPEAIALDVFGNLYVAGRFQGAVDFDPGPGVTELTSPAGESDASIFVAKYSPTGSLIWARAMGGVQVSEAQDIAVDVQGNVYITGWFNQKADLDPGPGEFIVTSPNFGELFVVKLNTNGEFVWGYANSNPTSVLGFGIAVDDTGNVYATGSFRGTVEFDPGAGSTTLTSGTGDDIFAIKLDPNGNLLWARGMGGADTNSGRAIDVDPNGNVYIGGNFQGTVDLNPGAGSFIRESGGSRDVFVTKLDNNGNFVWAKAMGGTGLNELRGLTVDADGRVHIAGFFNDTANFDPDITNFELTSTIGEDAFVAKLNTGGALMWAKALGVPFASRGLGITLDNDGNVYTTGDFVGTTDFNPGAGTFNLTSAGSNDAFISKLTSDGNFVWAKSVGGTGGDWGGGIAVSPLGAVHVTGRYRGTADFDPGFGVFNLTANGEDFNGDGYVLKLKGEIDAPPVGLSGTITDAITEMPISCAAIEIFDPDAGGPEVAVTDANGHYFFGPLPSGSYTVRVLAPGYTSQIVSGLSLGAGEVRTEDFALNARFAQPVITGRVTDAESGLPLVWVFARLFVNGNFVASSYTCGNGFYEIPLGMSKNDGEIDIEVEFSLPNFDTDTVEDSIDPAQGATVNGALQKSLLGISFLAGRVSGRAGAVSTPLAGARITLRGPVDTSAQTDANGLYFVDTLLDGSYVVTASADNFEGTSVVRFIAPGSGGEASFELLSNNQPEIPGDINNDGAVNAVDVQIVINAALGVAIDPAFNADINGDGQVNAVDVQLVINAALGLTINP